MWVGDGEDGIEDGGKVEGVDGTREGRGDDSSRVWKSGRVLRQGAIPN